MNKAINKLEKELYKLPPIERESLAERLIQSLDNTPLTEVEIAWVKEAEKRFSEYISGKRKGLDAFSALKQKRQEMGL